MGTKNQFHIFTRSKESHKFLFISSSRLQSKNLGNISSTPTNQDGSTSFNVSSNSSSSPSTFGSKEVLNLTDLSLTNSELYSEEYKYVCNFKNCGKRFLRKEHLKRHNRLHTGEKPYPCIHFSCKKSFSRYDNMMNHYRHIHFGGKNGQNDTPSPSSCTASPSSSSSLSTKTAKLVSEEPSALSSSSSSSSFSIIPSNLQMLSASSSNGDSKRIQSSFSQPLVFINSESSAFERKDNVCEMIGCDSFENKTLTKNKEQKRQRFDEVPYLTFPVTLPQESFKLESRFVINKLEVNESCQKSQSENSLLKEEKSEAESFSDEKQMYEENHQLEFVNSENFKTISFNKNKTQVKNNKNCEFGHEEEESVNRKINSSIVVVTSAFQKYVASPKESKRSLVPLFVLEKNKVYSTQGEKQVFHPLDSLHISSFKGPL